MNFEHDFGIFANVFLLKEVFRPLIQYGLDAHSPVITGVSLVDRLVSVTGLPTLS